MRKIWIYLALALLFISQAAYADRNLLNELIKDVTDTKGNYYMEYYLLSSSRIGGMSILWDSPPYVDSVIENPYALYGWHGIVPFNLYRNKILALSKFNLRRKNMQGRNESLGLSGSDFEIYTFKRYTSNVINNVLYTIEIVIGAGIVITKYDDNTPTTKQFFDYNEEFRKSFKAVIPPSQLQAENGWEADFKYDI
ncbi:MAG: hypothetical protein LBC07_02850 [Elusimicrobiota bacterium]|jgi:hypothetical protein|nr:hypothetical protein [Elusimicrobiota bacterium]